jgi:hypothetical protein
MNTFALVMQYIFAGLQAMTAFEQVITPKVNPAAPGPTPLAQAATTAALKASGITDPVAHQTAGQMVGEAQTAIVTAHAAPK